MQIALLCNNYVEVGRELERFYFENKDEVHRYHPNAHVLRFKDGTVLRGHSAQDNQSFVLFDYDQIFTKDHLRGSEVFMRLLYRIRGRSCVPEAFMVQILEDM